jgi:hypothetical protein
MLKLHTDPPTSIDANLDRPFGDDLGPDLLAGPDAQALRLAIDEHQRVRRPRFERFWSYYRNPLRPAMTTSATSRGWYSLAQEAGLPRRITGRGTSQAAMANTDDRTASLREIVIENDIGWRLHSMVDFLFSKPIQIRSTAADAERAKVINAVLDAVWEGSGGIALLQDMALLGHIYGHVDLIVRRSGARGPKLPSKESPAFDASAAAELVRIEPIEPRRGVPVLDPSDYRNITAYAIHFDRELNTVDAEVTGGSESGRRATQSYTEVLTARERVVYHGDDRVEWEPLRGFDGRLPVVHIQNMAQPFAYEGLGEVEPLIPLQDELNTRLSDRANRVTMQSFRMYLAKGIENFDQRPVGPGQVWSTSSPEASITSFGGDSDSPSEEAHIREVREAIDKISAVPPLASGVVRAKIGNLTSANALRITLMGVLSKTARKRVTYGAGIARVCELVLAVLDDAGVLKTSPSERGVRIWWPDPLPEDTTERVRAAEAKARLGIPLDRVISELDESTDDAGIM